MQRRRWFMHILLKSLTYRKGRSLLLIAVLATSASLVTSLGIVTSAMGQRVADEVRKYGANLVVVPDSKPLEVGTGSLDFGSIAEPGYLSGEELLRAVNEEGIGDFSFHLKGTLKVRGADIPAEGVDFMAVRRLYPWWQLQGRWPDRGEAVIGADQAARLKLKAGDTVDVAGIAAGTVFRISGVVGTGGEEDKLLFIPLDRMQELTGLGGKVSQARLLVGAGKVAVAERAVSLQKHLPGTRVREVRQVARTSEGLLKKVQLLMALVTGVVLVASASSVTSTMSMTVLERGPEIGLLKAIGGTRLNLVLIFSGEALLLALAGGFSGYLAGCGISAFVMQTVFESRAGFAPGFAGLSFMVSLILALLGSIGPMVSIFRLDPVKSLRGE